MRRVTGVLAMQTIAAVFTASAVFLVVGFIVSAFVFFSQRLMTETRPEIITFAAVLIGTGTGCYASRLACDAIFRDYSGRTIAALYAMLGAVGILVEIFAVQAHWGQITQYGQYLMMGVAGVINFWNRQKDFSTAD